MMLFNMHPSPVAASVLNGGGGYPVLNSQFAGREAARANIADGIIRKLCMLMINAKSMAAFPPHIGIVLGLRYLLKMFWIAATRRIAGMHNMHPLQDIPVGKPVGHAVSKIFLRMPAIPHHPVSPRILNRTAPYPAFARFIDFLPKARRECSGHSTPIGHPFARMATAATAFNLSLKRLTALGAMMLIHGCSPSPILADGCSWSRFIWFNSADVLTEETETAIIVHNETRERICGR